MLLRKILVLNINKNIESKIRKSDRHEIDSNQKNYDVKLALDTL